MLVGAEGVGRWTRGWTVEAAAKWLRRERARPVETMAMIAEKEKEAMKRTKARVVKNTKKIPITKKMVVQRMSKMAILRMMKMQVRRKRRMKITITMMTMTEKRRLMTWQMGAAC